MKVPEQLQESTIDASVVQESPVVSPNWLRLAYSFEYVLTLLVSVELWAQIGGQGHMDLIAWYLKLACILLQAWCVVRFTAAIVENPKVWTMRTRWWLASLVMTAMLMAGITFYYHLHEVSDETDSDEVSAPTVMNSIPRRLVFPA
jgi:Na+/proline symporter